MTHKCNEMHLIDDFKTFKVPFGKLHFSYVRQSDALFDAFCSELFEVLQKSLFSSITKHIIFSNQLQLFLV